MANLHYLGDIWVAFQMIYDMPRQFDQKQSIQHALWQKCKLLEESVLLNLA